MSDPAVWRSRPVFITSTFRDMHAERDWLRTRVFPALEERLRQRLHHLDIVDLRWGVDSTTAEQEAARELIVLTVCLGEIERSRPFLIGLLGDRYGWIPPSDRVAGAATEAGFGGRVEGHSITDLEIRHGVLGRPDQPLRSWFYLRRPLPYDTMRPEDAARYSDAHSAEPDARDKAAKLANLKADLQREFRGRVRVYSAAWDESARRVIGLEAWGAQVEQDLWTDLETETATFLSAAPVSWQAQDRLALDEFVESRVRSFVGRGAIAANLKTLATSPEADGAPSGACVTGEPGGGKSSLFGHLLRELQQDGLLLLAHAAGISAQSSRVSRMLRRWIGELAAMLGEPDPLGDDARDDEVDQTFARLLPRAAARRRVVILVDALNQFEGTPRGTYLTWLPKAWPANARLIATAIPGAGSRALLERPGTREHPLAAIERGEAAEIVQQICGRYHRTLNPGVQKALLAKRRREGTPAFGNPLWLEMATEELNLLGVEAFEEADARFADVASGGDRIIHLLLSIVDRMPGDVEGLYDWMLDGAEGRFGTAWTQAFTNAVALSRGGWRESDLRVLMPRLSGDAWDDLRFATLRRAFRAHVLQRGAQAQWDFAHAQTRKAVDARLGRTGTSVLAIHRAIVDHLWSLPADDPLRPTELMTHLIGAEDQARAARYYAGALSELAEDSARHALAASIIEAQPDDRGRRISWVCALLGQAGLSVPEIQALYLRFGRIVVHELFPTGLPGLDLAFIEEEGTVLARRSQGDPENQDLRDLLGQSRMALGQALEHAGETRRAAQVLGAALAIFEAGGAPAGNPMRLAFVHGCYCALGRIFAKHGLASQAALANEKAAAALASARVAGDTEARSEGEEVQLEGTDAAKFQAVEAAGSVMIDEATRRESAGNHEAALDAYRAACAAYEAFLSSASDAAETEKAHVVKQLADVRWRTGTILLQAKRTAEAFHEYSEARRLLEEVVDGDPGNVDAVYGLCFTHEKLADVLREQGRRPEATEALLASLDLRRKLVAQDPANPRWLGALALGLAKIGALREEVADEAGAQRYRTECADVLEHMRAGGMELEPRLERMRLRYQRGG